MRGRSSWILAAAVAAAVVALSGIVVVWSWPQDEHAGGLPTLGPPTSTASDRPPDPSPSLSDEDQIVDVYTRYNAAIRPARFANENERKGILEDLVTEDYLLALLQNMIDQDEAGFTLWGDPPKILKSAVSIAGNSATLTLCLDSSHGGEAEESTGRRVAVGPPRNPSQVALLQNRSGLWLVDDEVFPGGSC